MADKENQEAAPAEKAKAVGGSKLVAIVLTLNTVLLAAVLGVVFLKPASGAAAKPEAKAEGKEAKAGERAAGAGPALPGPTMKLPDFVVHLRDPEANHYARISFEVEVADEKAKEHVTAYLPQIRDSFLSYLSDRAVEELRGSEGISKLKQALSRRLVDAAPGAQVKQLLVTELVIQ